VKAEITFQGESNFVQVRRDGRPFGKIFHPSDGVYRFYIDDRENLGGADLQHEELDELKALIKSRYAIIHHRAHNAPGHSAA
jgi:hypothetical protein